MLRTRSVRKFRNNRPLVGCALIALAFGLTATPSLAQGNAAEKGACCEWPVNAKPKKDAPNILLIMTDDVGFSASSVYGGPIATPAFEALAEKGAVYNAFNTTAMCSPTRASLLTGRNPHNVGMGGITNLASGYEGYNTSIPKSAGTVAEILKQAGYNTAMFGKAHVTPVWEMTSAGPFDRWPTGLGFEYFYGFMGADTSQFEPALVENTTPVDFEYPEGYLLDADMASRTIGWIDKQKAVAPEKPFFVYYAPGTAHSPNHAPQEWLDRFRGKFSQGWDRLREEIFRKQKASGVIPENALLTPRPVELPAWDSLGEDQKQLSQRYMEAYAASLAFADEQIGRILQHLEATGEAENTMIVFVQGDNGSSGEGGPDGKMFEQSAIYFQREDPDWVKRNIDKIGGKESYTVFPAPWAWALNTPFQWTKQIASHLGGVRNGLVISWPGHIASGGEVRGQYHHVSDIAPTILDAAGIAQPSSLNGVAQKPMDGISMAYTFKDADAAPQKANQAYELLQNMAVYSDGWLASTTPIRMPWNWAKPITIDARNRQWELYDLKRDFSQATDLASTNPGKLAEMEKLFWKEAAENAILPIHDYLDGVEGRPDPREGRTEFEYIGKLDHIAEAASPPTIGRSHTITIDFTVPRERANGVLVAQGGRFGGYAIYLDEGRPVYHYNGLGPNQYTVRAPQALRSGDHVLTLTFQSDPPFPALEMRGGPGATATISVDDKAVATGRIERTVRNWYSDAEGLDIGVDNNAPVTDAYPAVSNAFTGAIRRTVFRIIENGE